MGLISKKAGIEHIDTNVVIRLITQDNEEMVKKAEKLLSKKDKTYVLEDAAMMEVVFVLTRGGYDMTRKEAADGINAFLKTENIYCNKGLIEDALNLFVKHPKLSFVDCYLAAITAVSQEKPLWTLDKKLATQMPIAKLA